MNTTATFSGENNQGFQLASSSGHVHVNFHYQASKLEEIHLSDEESRCFETLRTSNYLARKDLNPERLPGTCKWFLDHPKYKGWIAQTPASRLLWVSADPGCGKSVLAKALVDQYNQDDSGSVCYYFFKDETTVTRSAAHAICAILHQICVLRPALITYVLPMYRRNGRKLVDLFEDLWSAFVDVINDKGFGNVICIFDAVDECSGDDYKKLLQRLAAIVTLSNSIKILITSRPYTWIETALFHKTGLDKNEICLSGEAEAEQSMIENEVGFFIKFRVQEFRKLRESNGIFDNVHEKLQFHLDGVKNRTYLWVSAVFNELEGDVCIASEYILMETINALPENVHKAYEIILEKSRQKPILIRVLHIMLAAIRPLSVVEMNMVLSIQDTSSSPTSSGLHPLNSFGKWLRNLCGFFVNIVDNELFFAHQTAREFLVGGGGYQATVGWRGSFQMADSHTRVARVCIDYLLLFYSGSVDATFQTYATWYWPLHCQCLEVNQSLAEKVKGFLFHDNSSTSPIAKWTMDAKEFFGLNLRLDHRVVRSISSPPTPLFLACNFGWPSVIHVLMSSPDIDWNQKSWRQQPGLGIAAQEGHLEIVKLLLTAGADVNIKDSGGETALHVYASSGPLETGKFLLTAGADVNAQGYKGTALHSATSRGHLKILELLLTAGADVNIQNNKRETALHSAASGGHPKIVKFLLTGGADVNIQDFWGATALHVAASRGHLEIVELLLRAGADVNIKAFMETTELHVAASRGHLEIVELLLTAGADFNAESKRGTASHLAASEGHPEIVELLLTAGADVNIKGPLGTTALHVAASSGPLETVKLLLTAGVDVDIKDDWGETTLHKAVSKGCLETVKLLWKAGADVNIQNKIKKTALHLAALGGHPEIVKFLLTGGADVNIEDYRETTALHVAASSGPLETVKLLLTAGADVNIQNISGKTALHLAASGGHPKIVKFLSTGGADVNIQDWWGATALHVAVSKGYLEILEVLSTVGADVNIQNISRKTALHLAASGGHPKIVKFLLTGGADVNIKDYWGATALHVAASRGHLEIVELLLTAGADVNIKTFMETTALHVAASRGHLEIVELLLTAGADFNAESKRGTASHLAASEGHPEIVELLLTAGADVNAQSYKGVAALYVAASTGHLEIVELLLTAGADVNIKDFMGTTALHVAALRGHLEIVELLLTAGADVNAESKRGTALLIARECGLVKIAETLLAAIGREGGDTRARERKRKREKQGG